MPSKKKAEKDEKRYSYDEYRREFGVATPQPEHDTSAKGFGVKMAQEALKRVRRDIESKEPKNS
jgi:hypothetical protein